MIHYTCDRCHRVIDLDSEARYTVDIEAKAVFEAEAVSSAADDDGDHLLELHEILERLEEEEGAGPEADVLRHHFDLCGDCFKLYARNPIARELPLSIEFSEN